jgi:hypothetical protein
MSALSLRQRIGEAWKRPRGRITGAVYLLYFVTAIFAEFLVGRVPVVYSDAANLVATAWYVALTLLFYDLLKPASRSLSFLAALFGLGGCVVTALSVFHRAPPHIHSPLVFFGPYCLLIGYLVFRSTFLPRILGVLMALAGLGWLVFLSPVAHHLSSYLEALGILAEGSLMLWLLVMGVNVQRWKAIASRNA